MKEKLITLWHQQSDRDKRFLAIGFCVVLGYLFYILAYSPLASGVAMYESRLHEDKVTLAWMKSVESLARQKKQTTKKISSHQLLSVMSDALRQTGFKGYTYQLQQVGEHGIQLFYDVVPYNFFLAWLSEFSEKYQFSIQQLHVERLGSPGLVKMTLVVESGDGF